MSAAALPFRQSIAGCLEPAIGRHGLAEASLDAMIARGAPEIARLAGEFDSASLPLLRIAEETADVVAAVAAFETISEGAATIVFFGTGGSSLGGEALAQLGGWNIPGTAAPDQKRRPRTRFYDNLDADTLARSLAEIDLSSTRFVVTSKSGNTTETLVQTIAALAACRAAGLEARLPRLFLGITEPAIAGRKNGLRALLSAHSIPMLDHPIGIGGRFSALTVVGLLPALARGLEPTLLRAGARAVVDQLRLARSPGEVPALAGAATALALAAERHTRVQVMMPYANRLGRLAHWWVQLWAESLGKAGHGTTPLAALGPLDQHSQLQLFMDGPREHLVTVLRFATRGTGPRLDPALASAAGFPEMAGRHAGDLVDAQAHAVPEALARAGRPVRTFDLDRLDEACMGALMMHFMLETIIAGRMLGIDPFDQPAVELAKQLTRERLLKSP